MKLDRNINPDGKGKYALIKLREGKMQHLNASTDPDGNLYVHEYGVHADMTSATPQKPSSSSFV